MKQFMQRAYELVAEGWVQGALYQGWQDHTDDEGGDDDENVALLPKFRENITAVCSVGAMRLAFADLVGVPIHQQRIVLHDHYNHETQEWEDRVLIREYVDEEELSKHPFYQEGMKILGRAFYQAEQLAATRDYALQNPEHLLNGHEGRPYTVADVAHSIIGVNDASVDDLDMLEKAIQQAFKDAIGLAPEDLTYESEGNWYLTTATLLEEDGNGAVTA
jgi:hypothetical protein